MITQGKEVMAGALRKESQKSEGALTAFFYFQEMCFQKFMEMKTMIRLCRNFDLFYTKSSISLFLKDFIYLFI